MSQEHLKTIIGRAIKDEDFAKKLLKSPDDAIKEYDLSEEEVARIKAMDRDQINQFARNLDSRIMKKGDDWWVGSVRD